MHTHHYKKNGTISKSDWIKIRRFAVALVNSNLSLFSSTKINQDIIHLKPKKNKNLSNDDFYLVRAKKGDTSHGFCKTTYHDTPYDNFVFALLQFINAVSDKISIRVDGGIKAYKITKSVLW